MIRNGILRRIAQRLLVEPWPDTLILVRHAQSVGNTMTADERARCGTGTNLYELTALGERQADITGKWLRARFPNPDGFTTSYYTRTRATAERIYPDRAPYVDERLAEAQRGIWHVRTRAEITAELPWEADRRTREGYFHYRPWGGENWPDVLARIRSFNHTLHRRYAGKTVVIVTHGQWLMLWKSLIHHWSVEETVAEYERLDRDRSIENASVTIYRGEWWRGRPIIVPDPHQPYVVPWEHRIATTATTAA